MRMLMLLSRMRSTLLGSPVMRFLPLGLVRDLLRLRRIHRLIFRHANRLADQALDRLEVLSLLGIAE